MYRSCNEKHHPNFRRKFTPDQVPSAAQNFDSYFKARKAHGCSGFELWYIFSMRDKLKITEKYIPLDKSWIIRMGVLDIINGYKDIQIFLNKRKNFGDDLLALKKVSKIWFTNKPVDVGESGTLYRLLKFASWKLGLNKKFIIKGTLYSRNIKGNLKIINLSQEKLLKLDNGTSQWATASVLLGDKERIKNPPYKLKLTYEAVNHWNKQRKNKKSWIPKLDETIFNQAETFLVLLKGKKPKFIPEQAEDYCFARVFGYITKKEGEKKWPSLKGHESNRITEMEKVIKLVENDDVVTSKDHRVVQAIVMWSIVNKKKVDIKYPKSVNKSWPQFWDFIKWSQKQF